MNSISFIDAQPDVTTTSETAVVELFDPPMCCPTGLCGPLAGSNAAQRQRDDHGLASRRRDGRTLPDDQSPAKVYEQQRRDAPGA
ncbi:MAG: arsenic metallochaperone ArsD family protein [Chloroflexi bacterium]|nr:arsenic metallochaperone ArsD family protein [Chloroflexota bacterium]